MLDVAKSLPEDPEELRRFTALLLAEVKSQALLIEKLRHQLAGHRSHRFGASSETIEQLQLALETSEIAVAKTHVAAEPKERAGKKIWSHKTGGTVNGLPAISKDGGTISYGGVWFDGILAAEP